MPTILIVDDDAHIRDVIDFALQKAGFATVNAENGEQALARFQSHPPDLVVLDIVMPELDGTEVCKALRRFSSVPIVFLSSRDDEVDRILGLELGGDDYVTKPFSPRELVARIKAILRRGRGDAPEATAGHRLEHGRLRLDPDRYTAFWQEQEVVLTLTEFGILRTLLAHPGRVCSREQLMDGSYQDYRVVSDRTIDSHVRRVRAKFRVLGADPIDTLHGIGYRLGPC
ncbi:MAG TPA: response regulator [Candidatus Competibacteraceae bacterium]|nr:MAG: response regulator [Candidatus Competibacteraceae bacterium]HNW77822.1 response regulator [Candidatus Competibacteraceae bacterium]HQC73409.1 response regulator [Candidatus Competibacteraceae bacterium]